MKITNDSIKKVIGGLMDSIDKQNVELYEKLSNETNYTATTPEEFYFKLLYPHSNFIDGLISSEISKDNNINWILKHSQFIDCQFRSIIERLEGSSCCADKSGFIVRRLYDYFLVNKPIEFDWTQEYTYHYCKKYFTSQEQIIDFYESIRAMYYGKPELYLKQLKQIEVVNDQTR